MANAIPFNKKGHENQYMHNQVLQIINDTFKILNKGNIDEAKNRLDQGKKLIQQRKNILGLQIKNWLSVKRFRSGELTDNDEEEKRLKRAIRSTINLKESLS